MSDFPQPRKTPTADIFQEDIESDNGCYVSLSCLEYLVGLVGAWGKSWRRGRAGGLGRSAARPVAPIIPRASRAPSLTAARPSGAPTDGMPRPMLTRQEYSRLLSFPDTTAGRRGR
jgi:hypothetical protein